MNQRPRHFGSMQGKTYQLGQVTLVFKRQDGGEDGEREAAYSLIELHGPPGACVAAHRHPGFQETFVVLEGRFDFDVAGERRTLATGEVLVIPRGAPHGFTCTSPGPGRLLTISTPARRFEAFVAEISAVNRGGSPGDAQAVFARHGLELV